jgi:hypothetical protein
MQIHCACKSESRYGLEFILEIDLYRIVIGVLFLYIMHGPNKKKKNLTEIEIETRTVTTNFNEKQRP